MNVLLLPGLDGTGRLFEPFVRHTPEGASCTIASYPVDRELSYPECADLVADKFSPDEPYVIVAESFSGPVAILTASKRPPNLNGLVLCNTFAYRASWRGFGLLPWSWLFRWPIPWFSVGAHLTGFGRAGKFVDTIRAANAPVLPGVRASRLRSALTVDVRRELAGLDLPVVYLRGLQDRLVFGNCLRTVVETRPETTVVSVPGPHLLLQVEPERSWREITTLCCAIRYLGGRTRVIPPLHVISASICALCGFSVRCFVTAWRLRVLCLRRFGATGNDRRAAVAVTDGCWSPSSA